MNTSELTITKSNLHTGNQSKFYTVKAKYGNINFNATYDCKTNDIIIHEWYQFNNNQFVLIKNELKEYLKNIAA